MSTILLMGSVSLDGFMEGPDHDLSWHMVDEELHTHFNDVLRDTGVFIEGRRSHEMMADYWPTADEDPDAPPAIVDFAAIWKRVPKYVLSRTLESAPWATVLSRIDPDEIRAIAASVDGLVAIGGANVAAQFLALDLLDEIRLYVNPLVLGKGTPMFQADLQRTFQLLETRTFGNGVVLLRYGR